MKFTELLAAAEQANRSMLCVGLDPEPARFPPPWRDDPRRMFDFCAAIVDATRDLVIAFKPQIAYFAAHRAEEQLEKLMRHLRANFPHVPVILDAKRGDIGSTAEQYAREAFERYGADDEAELARAVPRALRQFGDALEQHRAVCEALRL